MSFLLQRFYLNYIITKNKLGEKYMNKTKRKIFEIAMKLFSEKGYEATSVEEITATVGVAKGTLYYHFNSKEEIFNFLIEEGIKLLTNSIQIKISKCETTKDKIRAIVLIQMKAVEKYENLLTIVFSQMWGNGSRNQFCNKKIEEYIGVVEDVIKEGIKNGDIKKCNSNITATTIFSLTSSYMMYKKQINKDVDILQIYKEYEKIIFNSLTF